MSLLTKAGTIGGNVAATGAGMSLLSGGAAIGILNPGTGALVSSGSTGLMGAAGSLMTNPWTIAIGAGLAGAALWVKSQGHRKANDWVQHYQNPWGDKAINFLNQFWDDRKAGTLTYEDAIARQNEFNSNLQDYKDQTTLFAGKGKDQKKVVDQMRKQLGFGDNGEAVAGGTIAGWQQSLQDNIDQLKPADPTAGIDENKPPGVPKDAPKLAEGAAAQLKKRVQGMQGRASTILAGQHDPAGWMNPQKSLLGY